MHRYPTILTDDLFSRYFILRVNSFLHPLFTLFYGWCDVSPFFFSNLTYVDTYLDDI